MTRSKLAGFTTKRRMSLRSPGENENGAFLPGDAGEETGGENFAFFKLVLFVASEINGLFSSRGWTLFRRACYTK